MIKYKYLEVDEGLSSSQHGILRFDAETAHSLPIPHCPKCGGWNSLKFLDMVKNEVLVQCEQCRYGIELTTEDKQ